MIAGLRCMSMQWRVITQAETPGRAESRKTSASAFAYFRPVR